MIKRWRIIYYFVALVFFLSVLVLRSDHACGEGTVLISIKDNGREIQATKGEILELSLFSHATAGYLWRITFLDPEYLDAISEENKGTPPTTHTDESAIKVGEPVLHVLRVKTTKTGSTELRMACFRSWEGQDQAVERFSVKIIIVQ
jgi:predicted secreted protein